MLSILLAILALCFLVIIHEFGHLLMARACGMRVDKFSVGFGPALWSKKIGETTYQIAPIPLGGYVQIAGLNPEEEGEKKNDPADPRLYPNRPGWQRFLVVLAGPLINYLFACFLVLGLNLSAGTPTPLEEGVMVGQALDGYPAAKAGLQMKDTILTLDGVFIKTPDEFVERIQKSAGHPMVIEIQRGHDKQTVMVTPVFEENSWRIGVVTIPKIERQHLGLGTAVKNALIYPVALTWTQIQGFKKMFTDRKALKEVGGPVQIVRQLKGQIRAGVIEALETIALISAALGFFNLLPIPALDGGRLLFIGWEMITRKSVSKKAEQWIHAIGFLLLLGLILLITIRDILKLIRS